jgi:signal transduction histidine kinase
LQRQELATGARKRLDLALGESARTRRFLEEILLYAKPLRLDLKTVDLGHFIERFLEQSQPLAAARDQELVLSERAPDASIQGDQDRLKQILSNLSQNACEAAPKGATIRWRVIEEPKGLIAAEVQNPGTPIPPTMINRIMEPFVSTKQSGTGLGLSIVKRLVEAQGGDVRITSDANAGTRVRIAFPGVGGRLE